MTNMNREQLGQFMEQTFAECLAISQAKNHDYTQGGEDALKNFKLVEHLGVTSTEEGIYVRLLDKMMRLATLLKKEGEVTDESFEDTVKDAINYLALLLASKHGQ